MKNKKHYKLILVLTVAGVVSCGILMLYFERTDQSVVTEEVENSGLEISQNPKIITTIEELKKISEISQDPERRLRWKS